MRNLTYLIVIVVLAGGLTFCSQKQEQTQQTKAGSEAGETMNVNGIPESPQAQITFVELGSVNCVPCKKMQPVMKSIETKYAGQIKVIFHDVWTEEGKPFATQYEIRLIPTQIFMDAAGKEIMRHEGFFPEKEIDAFLQSNGLRIQ